MVTMHATHPTFGRQHGLIYRDGTSPVLEDALDRAYASITRGDVDAGMQSLHEDLAVLRDTTPAVVWDEVCREQCLRHRLRTILRQDPITRRCYAKPRGYAGDAVLLDMIYERGPRQWDDVSSIGRKVCEFLVDTPTSRGVRNRRDLVAAKIDALARRVARPRVLSIACGHLREARVSQAAADNRLAAYIAFDQDPESLAVVKREHSRGGVQSSHGMVKQLVTGEVRFLDLDFAYAAGLYDYLNDDFAAKLTAVMFASLRRGGKALVANFAPEAPERGYMEAFMDWNVIYRSEDEVAQFASLIPTEQIAEMEVYRDPCGSIIYLELTRR